ncbi:alpha/beta fold hydrolase [Aquibacillus halophilus]|uniref:Alpha/beta fold hydrolase n=1 Tax=Aquibacillus halophilus TaxID=930132 RepID=A0A6A8DDY3_9BACI|nr:alpha/beta hydrolase [Aquibacillus halophilus]MRH42049.1 alpha/beta fold hydrolase [Aquibacillus halophilus]
MEPTVEWIETIDKEKIYMQKWTNHSISPKAIIQIAHGMAEHIKRYQEFSDFLIDNKIFVYGNDHRGHGKTGENKGMMGYFAEEQGFEKAVDDLYQITKQIKQEFPNVPVILFGHSMGSFLARRYIQKYNVLDGVILSGTGYNPSIVTTFGKKIAKREVRKKGNSTPSLLLNRLAFGAFNKKFPNTETKFDWLSRDKEQVKLYIDDPHSGFVPSASFFYDLFDGLQMIIDDQLIEQISKDLPILFISGDKDPVGNQTTGVKKVIAQYSKHGIDNMESIFYKDGRHEMLNETNREEVFQDILNWINQTIET